jgi:hypothetical protein
MANESSAIEQAVSRAIRDNLERIQRTTDELNQAVNDVVAACASSKPTNALPPMLRAQATAASIAAALEVLSRFVAVTLHPMPRSPLETEMTKLASTITGEAARPAPSAGTPAAEAVLQETMLRETTTAVSLATSHPAIVEPPKPPVSFEPPAALHKTEHKTEIEAPHKRESFPPPEPEVFEHSKPGPFPEDAEVEVDADFDVNQLSAEERELHRRANRVAKVSMQDIKMLRPEQVRLGREKKDLCVRLRDDIEKAHREYDRRFRPIMDHPVDYFYRWMVEILADGDAHALGEYPYTVPAGHR